MARCPQTWRGRRPLACTETRCAEPGRPCTWPGEVSPGPHGEPVRGTTVMHGCRESDRFIVPRKPANNGCPEGPAEEVEGRERAKGNAAVHSRDRTQGRATPVTRARPRTADLFKGLHVRPEAGARCGKTARRDLCGGRRVTGVPTATAPHRLITNFCRLSMSREIATKLFPEERELEKKRRELTALEAQHFTLQKA